MTTSSTVAHSTRPYRLSFFGVVRSELHKLITVRSSAICFLIGVLMSVGTTVVIAYALYRYGIDGTGAASLDMTLAEMAKDPTLAGSLVTGLVIGQISFIVMAAMFGASEYTTRQARVTYVACPHRGWVLASKAIAIAVTTFSAALICQILSYVGIRLTVGSAAGGLVGSGTAMLWIEAILAGFSVVVVSEVALALATILRSTAGSISIVILFLYVVATVLTALAEKWEWIGDIQAWGLDRVQAMLPLVFLKDPMGGLTVGTVSAAQNAVEGWQLAAATCGWLIIPLALAWLALRVRDI